MRSRSTRAQFSLWFAFVWIVSYHKEYVVSSIVLEEELVLDEELMNVTKIGFQLYHILRETPVSPEVPPPESYDQYFYYETEVDAAIVAKKNGYCFAVFRGTCEGNLADTLQNFNLLTQQVCRFGHCCKVRKGYWNAYNAPFRYELERDLRACAATCDDGDPNSSCVVLFGGAQGGGIATIAGMYMADLNPIGITTGMPKTVGLPCGLLETKHWIRFVNSRALAGDPRGLISRSTRQYDFQPFSPAPFVLDHFGHFVLLSEDGTGVAYIGLDREDNFSPHAFKNALIHLYQRYEERIDELMRTYSTILTYPVRTGGFRTGTYCSSDLECESNKCSRRGVCLS